MAGADSGIGGPGGGGLVFRHRLVTRVWHWLNAVALALMLMSGLMIFNAHPRLYWGKAAANDDVAWLEIGASSDAAGAIPIARSPATTVPSPVWSAPNIGPPR